MIDGWFILLLSLLLHSHHTFASPPTSRAENDAKLLNILTNHYAQNQKKSDQPIPMIGAAISDGCGTISAASVGNYQMCSTVDQCNLAKHNANDPEVKAPAVPLETTKYRWASITKTLGALLLQQAVKEGVGFSWNDKISKYFPGAANDPAFRDATVLSVASHTACMHADGAGVYMTNPNKYVR